MHETNPRNESTKQIFQKQTYESNPQYKSLSFGFANQDLQIQNLRIRKDLDLRISILKDWFHAIVLRIRKDSLDSLKQANLENWLDSWLMIQNESNNLRFLFARNESTKRIHETNSRNESTIRIFKLRIRESETSGFVRIRIRKSLFLRIHFVL